MSVAVAVVGASGRISRTKHLPALTQLQASGRIHRIAVVSRDMGSLKPLWDEFPMVIPTTYQEALDDPDISVVLDASGPQSRSQVAIAALNAGKNLLTEKPLGLNVTEARNLYHAAVSAGVVASMVRDKLYTPGFQALGTLLVNGTLGPIANITGEFGYWVDSGLTVSAPMQRPSWNYEKSKGGDIVSDLFTHWSYLVELIGEISEVSALSATFFDKRRNEKGEEFTSDVPDTLYVSGKCGRGHPFSIRNSWVMRPYAPFTLAVNGENATARTSPSECELFRTSGASQEIAENVVVPEHDDEFLKLWGHFLDQVNQGEPDVTGFRAGLRAAHVCAGIDESLASRSVSITIGSDHE